MIKIQQLDNGKFAALDRDGEIEVIKDSIEEICEYFGLADLNE